MADSLSNLVRPGLMIGGLVLSLAVLIPSGLIYDDLERQQELAMQSRVAALSARLDSLPPGGSRLEWQNLLQREEPLLTRLGIYDRRVFDDTRDADDGGDPQPFRAVVPFQDGRGQAFAEFELARGEPETLVERARLAAMISAAGGVFVFGLALFGVWGAGRLKLAGRAEAELEQGVRFETMSAALAKEFEAVAGAMKSLPEPESTALIPLPKARMERIAAELGILSSSLTPSIANVDAGALVRWVEQRAEGINLAPGPEGLRFASDANLLGEAVLRLVRNAAEAKPGGEVRVEFLRPKENALTIRVTDSGPGIATEALARVYDPFFTTKGPAAAGLGLPVARKLVSALGGMLAIENKADGGTAAEIRLENLSVTAV